MKFVLISAVLALVALNGVLASRGGGRSKCLSKWEECMNDQPAGEECCETDKAEMQNFQCPKPAKAARGYDEVITRESMDEDHADDRSRLKLKSKDRSNLELGNKDRVASGAESIRKSSDDRY